MVPAESGDVAMIQVGKVRERSFALADRAKALMGPK